MPSYIAARSLILTYHYVVVTSTSHPAIMGLCLAAHHAYEPVRESSTNLPSELLLGDMICTSARKIFAVGSHR